MRWSICPSFRDVQRIAIIGAEPEARRPERLDQRQQRRQILAHCPLADQDDDPLFQFLRRLRQIRRLVTVADAARRQRIDRLAAHARHVPVDMPPFERFQFGQHIRIFRQHAADVHELRQTDDARMILVFYQSRRIQRSTRCLQLRRWNAGRQLHDQIHDRMFGGIEKILKPLLAQHVGNLVRIAHRRRRPAWQDTAVEFIRRDQRTFDMHMAIDEPRHGEQPRSVNLLFALIAVVNADNRIAADGDIRFFQRPGRNIQHRDVFNDKVGGVPPHGLIDESFEHVIFSPPLSPFTK